MRYALQLLQGKKNLFKSQTFRLGNKNQPSTHPPFLWMIIVSAFCVFCLFVFNHHLSRKELYMHVWFPLVSVMFLDNYFLRLVLILMSTFIIPSYFLRVSFPQGVSFAV